MQILAVLIAACLLATSPASSLEPGLNHLKKNSALRTQGDTLESRAAGPATPEMRKRPSFAMIQTGFKTKVSLLGASVSAGIIVSLLIIAIAMIIVVVYLRQKNMQEAGGKNEDMFSTHPHHQGTPAQKGRFPGCC
mmetsp:Transcript_37675/g.69643  ORF Transcript_37675/g.69643 Transcript_37675/m.69643 type:complete len:136 (+) Transcript_37675:73-480(+)